MRRPLLPLLIVLLVPGLWSGFQWFDLTAPVLAADEGAAPRDEAVLLDELERARVEMHRVYAQAAAELPVADDPGVQRVLGSLPLWDEIVEAVRDGAAEDEDAWLAERSVALADDPVTSLFAASTWWVLLSDLRARAAQDEQATGPELLRAVLTAHAPGDSFADVWDERFPEHPSVRRFRELSAELAALRERAERLRVPDVGEPSLESMIAFDGGSIHVGPWIGWVQEIDERDNRRDRVRVRPFHVDRHEVTRGQYLAFLREQPSRKRADLLPGGWSLAEDGTVTPPEGSTRIPVTNVSYDQAVAYARSVGKRLPTEDEWDLVARGGDEEARAYPWGAEIGDRTFAEVAQGHSGPVEIDAYPDDVSPEGVVGLAGNVAEMVVALPDRGSVGRSGPKDGEQLIVRGGNHRARAGECVAAWRWIVDPIKGASNVGFRCVMDAAEYRRRTR